MAQTYLTFTDAAKLINLTYTGRENIGRRLAIAAAYDAICEKFKHYGIEFNTENHSDHDKYNSDRMKDTDPQLTAIIDKRWRKAKTICSADTELIPMIVESPVESINDRFVVNTRLSLYRDKSYRDTIIDKKMSPVPHTIIKSHHAVIDSILTKFQLKSEPLIHASGVSLRIVDAEGRNFHTYGVIDISLDTIFAPGRRFTVDKLAMMADQNYYMQMKKHTAHHRGQKTEFFVAPTPLFD